MAVENRITQHLKENLSLSHQVLLNSPNFSISANISTFYPLANLKMLPLTPLFSLPSRQLILFFWSHEFIHFCSLLSIPSTSIFKLQTLGRSVVTAF